MFTQPLLRTVPRYETFSLTHTFDRCIIYHLIYHNSIKLHINHLLLLHFYIFGIFFATTAASSTENNVINVLVTVAALLSIFEIIFTRCNLYGVSHVIFVIVPLVVAAHYLNETTRTYLTSYETVGIGLGIALFSLLLQIAGHKLWEDFQANAAVTHGLIAAPVLEWTCIFVRYYPSLNRKIWDEVDNARQEAGIGRLTVIEE